MIRQEFNDVHEAISKALWVDHTKELAKIPLEPVVSFLKFNGMDEAVRKLCELWGVRPRENRPYSKPWAELTGIITYLATYNPPALGTHPQGLLQHFKGGFYLVLGVDTCAETMGENVSYLALADGKRWSRSLLRFSGAVWIEDRFVPRYLQGSPAQPRVDMEFLKGKT